MTPQELQSLRNLGNECEAAADEIVRLRAEREAARADALALATERNNWQSMYQDAMAERDEAWGLLREVGCIPAYSYLRERIDAVLKETK